MLLSVIIFIQYLVDIHFIIIRSFHGFCPDLIHIVMDFIHVLSSYKS